MNPNNIFDLDKKRRGLNDDYTLFNTCNIFLLIILCSITYFYHIRNMEIPEIFLWGALVLFLATCFGFNRWYEYQKVLHNYQAIVNSKTECSPSEQVKPTSNKDKDILILDKENKNIYKLDKNTSKQIIELLNKQEQ